MLCATSKGSRAAKQRTLYHSLRKMHRVSDSHHPVTLLACTCVRACGTHLYLVVSDQQVDEVLLCLRLVLQVEATEPTYKR